jgi:hypothetical protein
MKGIVIGLVLAVTVAAVTTTVIKNVRASKTTATGATCDEDSLSLKFIPNCYSTELGEKPSPEIFVSVTTDVAKDGRVKDVRIDARPKLSGAEKCVRERLLGTRMRAKGIDRQRNFNVGLKPGFNTIASTSKPIQTTKGSDR